MYRFALVLLFLLVLTGAWAGVPVAQGATVYTKTNGVIQIRLNEAGYPMITSLSINGALIVPHNNAGADFQMTGRSPAGNAYNPTQGGDCRGNPSKLSGVIPNWSAIGGISTANGILLGIDPRNYNDPGGCAGTGSILPYGFNFGVTLGDDSQLPKQVMVLDLSMQRGVGSQEILKAASEMPVAFPKTSIMRYAYYSPNGVSFYRLQRCDTPIGCTHDTLQWPTNTSSPSINVNVDGRVIVLSTAPNAIEDQTAGFGMAFYSHITTGMIVSHRKGSGGIDLTLIAMVGAPHGSSALITDYGPRTLRRIMAVGNLGTIRAAIGIAQNRITEWGNW